MTDRFVDRDFAFPGGLHKRGVPCREWQIKPHCEVQVGSTIVRKPVFPCKRNMILPVRLHIQITSYVTVIQDQSAQTAMDM